MKIKNINFIYRRVTFGFLIILLSCTACLFSYKYAEANTEDRKNIISLGLSKDDDLEVLNKYLSSSDKDILNYLAVRQKLYSLSYEELTHLLEQSKRLDSTKQLNTLILNILSRMEEENIFLLPEDILIDNVPVLADSPFYEVLGQNLRITELKPHAEYVYLYNLKLKYKKNDLLKKTDVLWINPKNIKEQNIRKKNQNQPPMAIDLWPFSLLSGEASVLWSHELKEDNLTDYFVLRQWVKKYEENAFYPVVYKGTAIIRNEYRLTCLDILSGKEIWSFGNIDKGGQEFYQTFRHPHSNSYGYEFLLANDTIFTELSGKLIALKLMGTLNPQLIWKKDLGEYTVCTKPVQSKGTLIVGFINARGEFWICGFDCQSGELKWSSYIGLSSFLSPTCVISTLRDNLVFIGTNHGVLVCLDSNSGEIIWLKKYTPKRYSQIDFWLKGYYKERFLDVGSIKYDTQFIEIGNDGFLYYKPRESDYLYILDKDGQLQDEISIDPHKYYLLKASDGRGVFLEKTDSILETAELKIIDLVSGKEIYSLLIDGGPLGGVNYTNKNELVFKVDDTIHFLRMRGDTFSHAETYATGDGWLLNSENRFLFIGKDQTLFCWDTFNQAQEPLKRDPYLTEYFERRKNITDTLNRLFQLDAQDTQALELRKHLTSAISTLDFPLDDVFPILFSNLEKFRHPAWKEFIAQLQNKYSDEVITYRDVEIKFSNFLKSTGLFYSFKTENKNIQDKILAVEKKKFQFRADKAFLLPVKIIKGPNLPDFFLLLNNDQLICVHEAGNICWMRKVFYYPVKNERVYFLIDKSKGRMYTDDIQAYLYDNTLIINDHINIVALDVNDGTYIWSMTNRGRVFKKEKEFPPFNEDQLFIKYGIRRSFLKNVMLYANFIDDRLIVTHGNKIYSINPATGYCERDRQLNIEGAIEVAASNKHIYLISYFLDTLKVLDEELLPVADFPLNFLEDNKRDECPEIPFINDYIILHIGSDLYLLDGRSKRLKYKLNLGKLGRHYIEAYKDNLILIVPFKKLISYRLDNGMLITNWEFNLEGVDENILYTLNREMTAKKSKYYSLNDTRLYLPFRRDGIYFIASVDLETGKKFWEKGIEGTGGLFFNLSDFQDKDGKITFTLSTVCSEGTREENKLCSEAYSACVNSKLISLDIANGDIVRVEPLPYTQSLYFVSASLTDTENYLICGFSGILLKAERN